MSRRYNRIPLLCSHPGGVTGAGRIRPAGRKCAVCTSTCQILFRMFSTATLIVLF